MVRYKGREARWRWWRQLPVVDRERPDRPPGSLALRLHVMHATHGTKSSASPPQPEWERARSYLVSCGRTPHPVPSPTLLLTMWCFGAKVHCTIQCNTQYNTIQYNTIQYNTTQHNTTHCAIQLCDPRSWDPGCRGKSTT